MRRDDSLCDPKAQTRTGTRTVWVNHLKWFEDRFQ